VRAQGLPPALRIRRRLDFLRVQSQGTKHHVRHFLVFVVRNPTRLELPGASLGVTVTRKVGIAVVRNRIRRWVREAFRRERPGFASDVEMVWVAKRTAATGNYAEVYADMQQLSQRLRAREGRAT
jgi:ribonuclease P protein component